MQISAQSIIQHFVVVVDIVVSIRDFKFQCPILLIFLHCCAFFLIMNCYWAIVESSENWMTNTHTTHTLTNLMEMIHENKFRFCFFCPFPIRWSLGVAMHLRHDIKINTAISRKTNTEIQKIKTTKTATVPECCLCEASGFFVGVLFRCCLLFFYFFASLFGWSSCVCVWYHIRPYIEACVYIFMTVITLYRLEDD